MKRILKLLTAKELSLILNITERTVKKLAKTNQLPATYVNRRLHFDFNKVMARLRQLEGGAA
ncbi:MAG: helix-turn-helix domain-containing protein [Treponema sp.]|jgi:hypothetical protein|nr:helix-turn-helix domain-containing protein [Treponema sp.]